ncbi:hypothetical protein BC829DRAFT_377400 [Chytridium lagenaria]|nr:hypothetical protein BC829DRAFT_377400 [Chytridium lagenaria]
MASLHRLFSIKPASSILMRTSTSSPSSITSITSQTIFSRRFHGPSAPARLVKKDDTPAEDDASTPFSRPGPMPLGDKKLQQEFEELLKAREKEDSKLERHPDAEKQPVKSFEGDKNPVTGEIGGPKGAEPTRYGDWERKGRVYDF